MQNIIRYSSRRTLLFFALSDLLLPLLLLVFLHAIFSDTAWSEPYLWLGLSAGLAMVVGSLLLKGYSRYLHRTLAQKLQLVFQVWGFILVALLVVAFVVLATQEFGRKVLLIWAFLTPFVLLLSRLLINHWCHTRQQQPVRVLFLSPYPFTKFEEARLTAQNFQWQFLQDRDALATTLQNFDPDYVVLPEQGQATGSEESKRLDQQAWIKQLTHADLAGVKLVKFEQFMEGLLRKCFINYQSTDLAYLEQVSAYSTSQYLMKRTIDIAAALSLLTLVWPVMLYAMWKIRRESPGPVIFSQARVGRGGKEFTLYKFRSMHVDGHFDPYTQEDDPRIFPFGSVMRKTRIDELLQLWNVLKGDMHFFGPRSEWTILVDNYEKEIPFYHERHLVAPGISGWAQVLYPYGSCAEDARQKLMYDLYYIKNWSIWLEIETLIRTIGVVLGKKGI
ncbi:sugar transferase [Thiomicrospira sp. R3]|uniref:sugar transferase n=1 Tax=Thiomicrospira sp. R3 TaxID=3035472 RepID=UPI00259B1B32|nr:sugar transferase [Thiomicrospira sp. R3]WFE68788.1 sugar transferase [Thiomicrospira sp. R3]